MIQYSVIIQRNLLESLNNKEITLIDLMRKISENEKIQFQNCSNPELITEHTYQPRLFFDYDDGRVIQGMGEEYNWMKK